CSRLRHPRIHARRCVGTGSAGPSGSGARDERFASGQRSRESFMTDDLVTDTQGPWKFETVATSCGSCHKVGMFPSHGVYDKTSACIYVDGVHPSQTDTPISAELRANAHLIAAAPELLEALKLLYREMELSGNARSKDYGWLRAITKSREAIAKAEGKSHVQ